MRKWNSKRSMKTKSNSAGNQTTLDFSKEAIEETDVISISSDEEESILVPITPKKPAADEHLVQTSKQIKHRRVSSEAEDKASRPKSPRVASSSSSDDEDLIAQNIFQETTCEGMTKNPPGQQTKGGPISHHSRSGLHVDDGNLMKQSTSQTTTRGQVPVEKKESSQGKKLYDETSTVKQTSKQIKSSYGLDNDEDTDRKLRKTSDDVLALQLPTRQTRNSRKHFKYPKSSDAKPNTPKEKRNKYGETSLHEACKKGDLDAVRKLREQGYSVNVQDECGWTPLHEAAGNDFYDLTNYLLQEGANIDHRGGPKCQGFTPLIDAAHYGCLDIVELLLENDANPLIKDNKNMTAFDHLQKFWKKKKEDGSKLDNETKQQYRKIVNKLEEMSRGYTGSKPLTEREQTLKVLRKDLGVFQKDIDRVILSYGEKCLKSISTFFEFKEKYDKMAHHHTPSKQNVTMQQYRKVECQQNFQSQNCSESGETSKTEKFEKYDNTSEASGNEDSFGALEQESNEDLPEISEDMSVKSGTAQASCSRDNDQRQSLDHVQLDANTRPHDQNRNLNNSNRDTRNQNYDLDFCPEHKEERRKFYCKSHDTIMCSVCTMLRHKHCVAIFVLKKLKR